MSKIILIALCLLVLTGCASVMNTELSDRLNSPKDEIRL